MKKILIAFVFLALISFLWAENRKPGPGTAATGKLETKNIPVQKKDWNGTWETNWGAMVLTQKEDTLEGEYEHDSGKIKGILSKNGKVVRGKWSESPSYKEPNDAGDIEFTLDSDDKFTGKWRYGSAGTWNTWTGTRKK